MEKYYLFFLFFVAFTIASGKASGELTSSEESECCPKPTRLMCANPCNNVCRGPLKNITYARDCVCNGNYSLNSNNKCVPASECDCPTNEEVKKGPYKICDIICDCKEGYQRNSTTGNCELICKDPTMMYGCKECEQECGKSAKPCDPKICTKDCICKTDYARNCNGVCIPKTMCTGSK